ncbi:hypothetical protein OAG76_03870 [Rubripirellula sp.]|nr:hypothetical protein [Rubripirellula sp.]MDB4634524.1 hypothetical protein [Rubripirellula sp.]
MFAACFGLHAILRAVEDDGDSLIKKIAGYHQFRGVRQAVRVTTIAAADSDDDAVRERPTGYGDKVQHGSQ